MSVTTDVRDRLIAAGVAVAGSTSAWSCFIGGLSDHVTQPQIAVLQSAGLAPVDVMGTDHLNRPGVQLLIRGDVDGYAAAEAKADAAHTALHRQSFGDNITTTAIANPYWLGYEPDTGRPVWSINFTTLRR